MQLCTRTSTTKHHIITTNRDNRLLTIWPVHEGLFMNCSKKLNQIKPSPNCWPWENVRVEKSKVGSSAELSQNWSLVFRISRSLNHADQTQWSRRIPQLQTEAPFLVGLKMSTGLYPDAFVQLEQIPEEFSTCAIHILFILYQLNCHCDDLCWMPLKLNIA